MIDRNAWRQRRTASMGVLRVINTHVNAFCARMNAGLAMVALVLAVVTVATAMVRLPDIIDQTLPPVAMPDNDQAQ